MYKIKRFSAIFERMFAMSLSEYRKLFTTKNESTIVTHILLYFSTDEDKNRDVIRHWNSELTTFICNEGKDIKFKLSQVDYVDMFKNTMTGTNVNPGFINIVRSNLLDEGRLELVDYLTDNDLLKILRNLLRKIADELNDAMRLRNRMLDKSDRKVVSSILKDIKSDTEYKLW